MEKEKDLVFICAQPNILSYKWQVNVLLESMRKFGYSSKAHILLYNVEDAVNWDDLIALYPETQFFTYEDQGVKTIHEAIYIPILRPHILAQHFRAFPELKEKAIFYHDSDIIFTKPLDIDKYIQDDICYLSDTVVHSDYMSHKYFEAQEQKVLPHKLNAYKKRDILQELANIVGISRETIVDNYRNTGGAQYLLKNIDGDFWEDVQNDSFQIVVHLRNVNRQFFKNEDAGIQSWCADMWGLLYNLWKRGLQTRVVKEMDFSWATDKLEKLENMSILHNAGITDDSRIIHKAPDGIKHIIDCPAFYKGIYNLLEKKGLTPFTDLEYVLQTYNNPVSHQFCTWKYAEAIIETQKAHNLAY